MNESFLYISGGACGRLWETRSVFQAIVENAAATFVPAHNPSLTPLSPGVSGVFHNRGSVHRPYPRAQIRSPETTGEPKKLAASCLSCSRISSTFPPAFNICSRLWKTNIASWSFVTDSVAGLGWAGREGRPFRGAFGSLVTYGDASRRSCAKVFLLRRRLRTSSVTFHCSASSRASVLVIELPSKSWST